MIKKQILKRNFEVDSVKKQNSNIIRIKTITGKLIAYNLILYLL